MTQADRRTALNCAAVLVLAIAFQPSVRAQDAAAVSANTAATGAAAAELQTSTGNVPRLIKFSGVVTASDGKAATGVVPLTFTLYNAPEEGANLWTETQSAQLDAQGHYSVLLGAASTAGLPLDLFASGSALWLGVTPDLAGVAEPPRVLLVAVPYALKAADADTLGGKPASAYALLQDQATSSSGQATGGNLATASSQAAQGLRPGQRAETSTSNQNTSPASSVGGSGLIDFIPVWTGRQALGNSIMFQALDKVGVGTKTPGARLEAVSPDIAVRGTSYSPSGTGVSGINTASSGNTNGVYGASASPTGSGVAGISTAASGFSTGVYGQASSVNGTGVYGSSAKWVGVGGMGYTLGVWGDSATTNGTGVAGYSDATSGYGNGVYGQSASPGGTGMVGVNSSSAGGTAVAGVVNATSGNATGVAGTINSTSGAGVTGVATATSGYTDGVYGQSASINGYGVNGNATGTSGGGTGVLGSSSGANGGIGVWGSYQATSGSGVGVRGDIESTASGTAGLFINFSGNGLILSGVSGSGPTQTQVFSVDSSGNLDINGNLTVAGSKSARVKMQDGREVALYAVESPENWFEDFGTAQLQGGAAQVSLEPGYLQTVDTAADYHVFLTPKGDCHGLYIATTTSRGFEVRELGGGNASITFDYRIVAHRRGFEKVRLQEVHPAQVSPEVKAKLASMPPHEPVALPPPPKPRIMIPVMPHAPAQAH